MRESVVPAPQSPFHLFSSPPVKYHSQLIHVPIDFNPPTPFPFSILSCLSTIPFLPPLLWHAHSPFGTPVSRSTHRRRGPSTVTVTLHCISCDCYPCCDFWSSDLLYSTTGARRCWPRQYSDQTGNHNFYDEPLRPLRFHFIGIFSLNG